MLNEDLIGIPGGRWKVSPICRLVAVVHYQLPFRSQNRTRESREAPPGLWRGLLNSTFLGVSEGT